MSLTPRDDTTPFSEKDKKKDVILQILPSLVSGGVERGTLEIANALIKTGRIAIVASSGGPMVAELEAMGAKHITIPLATKNPIKIWTNAELLTDIVSEYHVDIIHARSRAPAWSAWLAWRYSKKHFVTTFHSAYSIQNYFKKLYNSVMAKGERVIAISRYVGMYAQNIYDVPTDTLRVIPRGVDLEIFDPDKVEAERIDALKKKWKLPEDRQVIMLPGRLSRWKGQEVFIEAISLLNRKDIACLIVGGGDEKYRKELQEKINSLNLRKYIVLTGACDDMPAAYCLADIVVSASTQPEGFGRVIVEGEAMSRLVIATDHGGASETIIEGKTGWLIKPGDPVALTQALQNVLDMSTGERKLIIDAAATHVRQHFTTAQMAARTLAVYDELLHPVE
jgi:glycosyltransferase involved in cell wall biosynthesis